MAMQGYTKLFNSILASSIWSEPDHTRIVWITILAMADKDGNVAAALPGLAALSRVSLERCKEAVLKLESPDEFSRTAEFEGRRIEKIDGGWRILNYMKFRKLLSTEERREYLRVKQQEHRDRVKDSQQPSTQRSLMSTLSTHTDSEADSDTDKTEEETSFARFWDLYPRKVGRQKARAIWGKLKRQERDLATERLKLWKQADQWHRDDGKYVPHGSTFLSQRRWEDEPWSGAFNEQKVAS